MILNWISLNCKLLSGASFLGIFALYFPLALLDLGLGFLIFTAQKYKFGNIIWRAHKIYLLILTICAFCIFEKFLVIFFSVFYSPIILLILAFSIRQFSFTSDGKYNRWSFFHQIRNFFYYDSSFVILIVFGSLIGTVLKGAPFYFDNNNVLTSLFTVPYLFSLDSLNFISIIMMFSVSLALLYYCIGKTDYKTLSLIFQFFLICIFILNPKLNDNTLIGLQTCSFICIILNQFKIAFLFSIFNISVFIVILVFELFPFMLLSSLEKTQNILIYNCIEENILIIPIFIACLIWIFEFWRKLIFVRNVDIQKDNFYMLIMIASILMTIYFIASLITIS